MPSPSTSPLCGTERIPTLKRARHRAPFGNAPWSVFSRNDNGLELAEGAVWSEPVSHPEISAGRDSSKKGGVQNTKQPHTSSARRSEPLHRKAAARLALRLILTKRVICGGPKFNWILGDSGSRVFRGKAVRRTA